MSNQKVALIGNPNTGKTSVFNRLTGLNQHVGNFPGVTVDKKIGIIKSENGNVELIDFPGTYSIYPRSLDERVVYDVLLDPKHEDYPDLVLVVVDASNLERNLLLFTQVYDLNFPVVLIVNMSDVAFKKGISIDIEKFNKRFPDVKIIETNARAGTGISRLKEVLNYRKIERREFVVDSFTAKYLNDKEGQNEETKVRFQFIRSFLSKISSQKINNEESKHRKLDKILTHRVYGYAIFLMILLFLFQLIFSFASFPMDLIDGSFANLSSWIQLTFPPGLLTDLLSQGIVPGLGGVLVFIPQIGLLFLCLGILEETGYMARVVFIMDRLMRPFGLNGKSVVPLMSSAACAIPGIMATRTIANWKERIITIMVAPLISCSARIPVFTLLIALVIPNQKVFGFFNLQGLTLFMMYFLGVFSALLVAFVMKSIIKSNEISVLMLELPDYKSPRWWNVFINLVEKIKLFTFDAGKVILAISILLWALASYGPGDRMEIAVKKIEQNQEKYSFSTIEMEEKITAAKLENSYMGILGKTIEPIIKPLGYDWKIGIALLTSFAAREVFVGSMATIYSVHDESDTNLGLINKLKHEKNEDGTLVYNFASGVSLMIFYVFAMQCMATLAVVKRETKSWRWPIFQLFYMGVLAYFASFVVYQVLK
jgi:ferrous iron transport protein B